MNSVKVLHCSDLHIGTERGNLGNRSKTRRAEVRKCLHRILDLCRTEQVQLLLIAGDLFDDVRVPAELLEEVRDAFLALSDTVIAVAAGNHDPATPDSPYQMEEFWPENVILFNSQLQCVELQNLGVRLIGAGFTGSYCYHSLLRKINLAEDGLINIGLLHGETVSDNSRSDYNAITARQIEQSGLDYLALGHIHKRTPVQKAGNTSYAYSGCPEGQGFDEAGDKGVYIGTVAKGYCHMEYRSVCRRKYTLLDVNVTDCNDRSAVVKAIRSRMQEENKETYPEHIYRVRLIGEPAEDVCRNIEDICQELDDIWYLKIKNETRIRVNTEELLRENSLRGVFVKRMLELKDGTPEAIREQALRFGLKAFHDRIEVG